MIVEHNQSSFYDNKYKFNGKELDNVTQMYYYGARYYDPRISIFVSVDPLAEQTMEPYLYTGNNPIMFTDPTGMSKVWQGGDPPKKSKWSFAKIKSDLNKAYNSTGIRDGVEWLKNNDLAGSVGGYILSGIGGLNFGGWFTIKGKPKVMKVGDWSSSNAGGASLRGNSLVTRTADGVQSVNTTVSTGVSIKEAFEPEAPQTSQEVSNIITVQLDTTHYEIDVSNRTVKGETGQMPFTGTPESIQKSKDSIQQKNEFYENWFND